MTENEMLKIAVHCLGVQAEQEVCEECPVYRESGIVCKEIARTAISTLKEIQQYRQIGTVEEVEQNARDLKRQIEHSEHLAEVLKATQNLLEKRENLCPTCESFIGYVGNNIFHYCPVCGQAIDDNLEGMEDV